jgi:hypothetical protein
MKMWLTLSLVAASIVSTVSCTSVTSKSDRDPASIAVACTPQSNSSDLAALESQAFLKLQAREKTASKDDLAQIYEAEFARLQQMVTKSGLYSAGLIDSVDPRLALVRKARGLGPQWDERFYTLSPADRPNPTDDQVQRKAGDLIRIGKTEEARKLLHALSNKKTATVELRMSARLDLLKS